MAGAMPLPMLVPRTAGLVVAGDAGRDADDLLMSQVRAGQVEALTPLFDRHHGPLLNYFVRLGTPRGLAEDLVQDTFVRILKYRATYRPGGRFATWMYFIARNVRLDQLHKRRGEVEWDDAYSPQVMPSDRAQAAQEQALLEQAMARLPEDKREILVLSRFHELKHEEIGAILGCETGTVKVRVHRAMKELKAQFEFLSARGVQ